MKPPLGSKLLAQSLRETTEAEEIHLPVLPYFRPMEEREMRDEWEEWGEAGQGMNRAYWTSQWLVMVVIGIEEGSAACSAAAIGGRECDPAIFSEF